MKRRQTTEKREMAWGQEGNEFQLPRNKTTAIMKRLPSERDN